VWFPESLNDAVHGHDVELRGWSYVVIEEIVDAVAVLSRWPWPLADQCGGLFWDEDDEHERIEAAVPLGILRTQLYEHNRLKRRPRSGDTFATSRVGGGWAASGPLQDLHALFPEEVYDISADAYEAVRLAYQSSVAAVFAADQHDEVMSTLDGLDAQRSERQAPQLEITQTDEAGEGP
jgi:hypothetical protein